MSTIGNYDKFLQLAAGGHVVVCPSCKDHGVNVLEDGSTRCVLTGETFVATEANSDLFELRQKYERRILDLALRTGRDWEAVLALNPAERDTLETALAIVDQYHKNRSSKPLASNIAVQVDADIDENRLNSALELLVAQGWRIDRPQHIISADDAHTFWLMRYTTGKSE